jgi:hypothetical protein
LSLILKIKLRNKPVSSEVVSCDMATHLADVNWLGKVVATVHRHWRIKNARKRAKQISNNPIQLEVVYNLGNFARVMWRMPLPFSIVAPL